MKIKCSIHFILGGMESGFPYMWIAPSSVMVYWAIAESFLRAQFLCRPISKQEAMLSVLSHVEWESDSQPLLDETMFYLDWVLENVSYAELL